MSSIYNRHYFSGFKKLFHKNQVHVVWFRRLSELKQEIKEGETQITQLQDKLTVNMVDKILFDSGSAVIKKNGEKVLDRVADILKGVTGRLIKVEGHTDNVPISARLIDRFPSNWELSTARATTVVRYLQGGGVNPVFLSRGLRRVPSRGNERHRRREIREPEDRDRAPAV